MNTIILDFDGTIVDLKTSTALASSRTLRYLQKKYNLALVTGSSKKEVEEILYKFSWQSYFKYIITRDDIGRPKSTGVPFKIIKNKTKGKIVAIGDSISDVQGCEKANIELVLVKSGANFSSAAKIAIKILEK
jgi:phosphoglycolate phosphatase-like HAD superfamily hydrolase